MIDRPLLGAGTGETNLQGHRISFQSLYVELRIFSVVISDAPHKRVYARLPTRFGAIRDPSRATRAAKWVPALAQDALGRDDSGACGNGAHHFFFPNPGS